jgi:hypothetical protein
LSTIENGHISVMYDEIFIGEPLGVWSNHGENCSGKRGCKTFRGALKTISFVVPIFGNNW